MVSFNCPIVILDGIACGLIMMSGLSPFLVYGMSHSGMMLPTVPFCPCLDELPVNEHFPFLLTRNTSDGTLKQYTFPLKSCVISSV